MTGQISASLTENSIVPKCQERELETIVDMFAGSCTFWRQTLKTISAWVGHQEETERE